MNYSNNKIINNKLVQQSHSHGEVRYFEIYNDQFIKSRKQNLLGKTSYHINLSMLQPWPVHHRQFSARWLISTAYFGFATLIYLLFMLMNYQLKPVLHLLPFIVILTLLTLASLIMFLYRSPNIMEFRSRYGNCTLLHLLHNKPNKAEFKRFADEIKTRILVSSQNSNLDKKNMMETEKTELTRLKNDGIISNEDYLDAIKRIENINI
ncbi:MAG: hypothetical protein OEY89_03140 [Gammaproteobacteria bacterium]|nr:hypothetical protein [Gammaproteobacteria bacterium]